MLNSNNIPFVYIVEAQTEWKRRQELATSLKNARKQKIVPERSDRIKRNWMKRDKILSTKEDMRRHVGDSDLSFAASITMQALLLNTDEFWFASISKRTMADGMKVSESTIKKGLKELTSRGLITVEHQRNERFMNVNLYQLHPDRIADLIPKN